MWRVTAVVCCVMCIVCCVLCCVCPACARAYALPFVVVIGIGIGSLRLWFLAVIGLVGVGVVWKVAYLEVVALWRPSSMGHVLCSSLCGCAWVHGCGAHPEAAPAPDVQGKHVKFSAAVDDEGHGTIKRKPTAFVRTKAPVAEEEEEDEEVSFLLGALCRSYCMVSLHGGGAGGLP